MIYPIAARALYGLLVLFFFQRYLREAIQALGYERCRAVINNHPLDLMPNEYSVSENSEECSSRT
jgi:hypothetical protein